MKKCPGVVQGLFEVNVIRNENGKEVNVRHLVADVHFLREVKRDEQKDEGTSINAGQVDNFSPENYFGEDSPTKLWDKKMEKSKFMQ